MKLKYAKSPFFFSPTCLAIIFLIQSVAVSAQVLQYNHEYTCSGERVVVGHCRRDSDQPGFPRTTDADNYCMVYYPDRPKQGGFEVQKVELRGDIVKKLQDCGTFAASAQTATSTDDSKSLEGELAIASGIKQTALNYQKANNETAAVKEFDLAIIKYKEIITRYPFSSYPKVANAYIGLGNILLNYLHKKDQALHVWIELRKLTPNDSTIAILLGQTQYQLKHYEESLKAFHDALALGPDAEMQGITHVAIGYIYKDQGQFDKALLENLEARRVYPGYADASHFLAISYYNLKNYPKAIEAFQQAIQEKYSPSEQPYNWIGYIYIEQKMYDKALPFLNETFRSKPDYPTTSGNLGNAYFGLGRYADALSAYQLAAKLEPNNAQYLYNIGFTYVKLGKKAEAMLVYNSLKKLDAAKAQELQSEINKL